MWHGGDHGIDGEWPIDVWEPLVTAFEIRI
jgi:hypothetical protein